MSKPETFSTHNTMQYGRTTSGCCQIGTCGSKRNDNELDELILKWWRSNKAEQKQRLFGPRLQDEIENQAAHDNVPYGFNAADLMQRFSKRNHIGDLSGKQSRTKSPDQFNKEVQNFHNFCHTVCAAPGPNVAPQNRYNLDDASNTASSLVQRNICSLNGN